jgi:hypothetical protein
VKESDRNRMALRKGLILVCVCVVGQQGKNLLAPEFGI